MLTELQKKAAQAIVNIFETSRPLGDYSKVTLIQGDTGHLTYGRSQTTLASGNLYLLIKKYCESAGAEMAEALMPYLGRVEDRDVNLDRDMTFRRLLRDAGEDPVMQQVQDRFFDSVYWQPAIGAARSIGVSRALGVGVVYDSHIHGSWHRMRDRTNERFGQVADIGEERWIAHYIDVRHDWLAGHSNTLLHRTTYRMDAFREFVADDRWALPLPFTCRGVRVDEATLTEAGDPRAGSEADEMRLLRLKTPFLQGDDVRAVQQALADAGVDIRVDGIYGPATESAVSTWQRRKDLVVDGIVGPGTRASLGIGD
ncbi:chitosanase [Marinobacter lacisalsi]|uniref:Chitosanase n=1 Tax=Marinobacter lacisalsi TaxID=475979 RepID=A0ABV8QMN9_9GAMM